MGEKTTETQSWFIEKINKIENTLKRLIKTEIVNHPQDSVV